VSLNDRAQCCCTGFYFRASEMSKILDITIDLLITYETWAIINQSECIGDGFESHAPESHIFKMIYNQTNRLFNGDITRSKITRQMTASLEEITVTQEIIGK